MDTLHVTLQWDDAAYLDGLRIAVGAAIQPTHIYMDPTTKMIQLTCYAPLWAHTQSPDKSVTLYILVYDSNARNVIDAWPFGYFTYIPRKRPSSEMPEDFELTTKRARGSSQSQQPYVLPEYSSYYDLPSQYMATSTPGGTRSHQPFFQDTPAPGQMMYPYRQGQEAYGYASDPMGLPTQSMGQVTPSGVMPHELASTGSYGAPPPPMQSQLPVAPPQRHQAPQPHPSTSSGGHQAVLAPAPPAYSSPYQPRATPVVPTSPSTSMASSTMHLSSMASMSEAAGGADPFAQLISHADLVIEGDMMAMVHNWSDQELQDRRRLVQFWRRQTQNQIICQCQAIAPTNRANHPEEIIISCIYWADKNDYYITSVDIIYLLEGLIGARFTTEERNRVRRNLEGLQPLTVSKGRDDTADFFRMIMAFNHPKPRNIEKDLKVFPWTSLPEGMKKIISKYTASYSSTASLLPSSSTSTSPPRPPPPGAAPPSM
ncbi:hypothetical protein BC940DRAFT_309963 [Gongronella butleri]|nr:hypothetical protein BC940DRAFT_309963 [Gongronella butleri]